MTCTQCSGSGTWMVISTTFHAGVRTDEPLAVKECQLCDVTGEQRRTWPFSNGMEFAGWVKNNCSVCAKSYDNDARKWRCDIERALGEAYLGNGTMPIALARRAELDGLHAGDCKEKELK